MGVKSETTVTVTAADKKYGMTVDELAAFATNIARAGLPGDTPLYAVHGMRGQLQKLETRPDKVPSPQPSRERLA